MIPTMMSLSKNMMNLSIKVVIVRLILLGLILLGLILLGLILWGPTGIGYAEGPSLKSKRSSSKSAPRRYTLSEIEHFLDSRPSAHILTQYELGTINWTTRTLHTIGVGTHQILSPTGGWTKRDLYAEAVENAHYRLDALALALYEHTHQRPLNQKMPPPPPPCDWHDVNRIFYAESPHMFSDGSVHLSASTHFEIYRACLVETTVLSPLQIFKHNPAEKPSPVEALDVATQIAIDWSTEAHEGRRSIVLISLEDLSQDPQLGLSPKINLRAPGARLDLTEDRWRAVRWLRSFPQTKFTASLSLKGTLKEPQPKRGIELEALGDQDQLDSLKALLSKREGGAELWLISPPPPPPPPASPSK